MEASTHIPLSEEAALVTALASTAMPFSHCAEDEAERWLRVLRLHGDVGRVLQAVGVGEAPLETTTEICAEPTSTPPMGRQAFDEAVREAERHAVSRSASSVETSDLLLALFDVYGDKLDHALETRGASRAEVLERLGEITRGV